MKKFEISKNRRVKVTPYTSRLESYGVGGYTVYNHMLLPTHFKSLEDEYFHLKKDVQLWDVSVQKQIEVSGSDSYKLVQLMTCRDLSGAKVFKCYYVPLIDGNGNMINDPLVLKVEDMKWRICIADSDVLLYAKGIADSMNLNVQIHETEISTLAVQGPKSLDVMKKVFGDEIGKLKFFNFNYFKFEGIDFMISKSGFSKQGGYEIYVENLKSGLKLYDYIIKVGKKFNLKPGCPNVIERIEGALLSYGNDMDNNDNPLECGLDKFVHLENDIDFLGKEKLIKIKENGINKKLMGVKINLDKINLRSAIHLTIGDKIIGEIRSAVFSPTFKMVIGIAMINKPYFLSKDQFDIVIENRKYKGEICDIPFV